MPIATFVSMKTLSIGLAAALTLTGILPAAAQIKGKVSGSSMYGSVPVAWANSLQSLATQLKGESIDLTRSLPTLNTRADI